MTDSTMSPVYEAGDTLLLDAAGPRKTGRDYVFCTDTSGDVVDARVGRLVASTPTHWSCRQWNPQRIIRLDRAEWPHAILIAGAYRRGSRPSNFRSGDSSGDSLAYFDGGRASDGQPRSNRFHEQKNRPGGGAGC